MTANYANLNRTQRLAALLVLLGPESAGELLRQFDGSQLEAVAREMVSIPYVDPEMRDSILEEFANVVSQSMQAALGGVSVAHESLERAKGDFTAQKLILRVAPTSSAELSEGISEMDGRQIFNLLRAEQMQTIAFILSFMEPAKSSEVIRLMSPEQREEVIERLGVMEPTSRDWIKKVSKNIQKHFDRKAQQGVQKAGRGGCVRQYPEFFGQGDPQGTSQRHGQAECFAWKRHSQEGIWFRRLGASDSGRSSKGPEGGGDFRLGEGDEGCETRDECCDLQDDVQTSGRRCA